MGVNGGVCICFGRSNQVPPRLYARRGGLFLMDSLGGGERGLDLLIFLPIVLPIDGQMGQVCTYEVCSSMYSIFLVHTQYLL